MKATTQLRFAHPYLLIFAALCSLTAATFSGLSIGVTLWVAAKQADRDARQAQMEIRLYQLERPAEILTDEIK